MKKLLACMILAGLSASAYAEAILVGHSDLSVDSLTQKEVAKIFLGKTSHWIDSTRANVCYLKDSEAALLEVVGKSKQQYKFYWNRMLFSGKGVPPVLLENTDSVADYVKSNKGSICFTSELTGKAITMK